MGVLSGAEGAGRGIRGMWISENAIDEIVYTLENEIMQIGDVVLINDCTERP